MIRRMDFRAALVGLLFAFVALSGVEAQAGRTADAWGLGILLGEPTALTAERQLTRDRAVDMGLGYSWGHAFHIYGDYLFQFLGAWEGHGKFISEVTPYIGVGGFFQSHDSAHLHVRNSQTYSTTFGARIPLGADWYVPNSTVQLFVELVPAFVIIPGLSFDFFGGVGARYFF